MREKVQIRNIGEKQAINVVKKKKNLRSKLILPGISYLSFTIENSA